MWKKERLEEAKSGSQERDREGVMDGRSLLPLVATILCVAGGPDDEFGIKSNLSRAVTSVLSVVIS